MNSHKQPKDPFAVFARQQAAELGRRRAEMHTMLGDMAIGTNDAPHREPKERSLLFSDPHDELAALVAVSDPADLADESSSHLPRPTLSLH